MDKFLFRCYCVIEQQGVDRSDAANRLKTNLNDSSNYVVKEEGATVYRYRDGSPDPGFPARIAQLIILPEHKE